MPKVLCLCRGSVRDGLGHVTRTRTVARAFSHRADVRIVVVGDGCADALLAGRGLDYALVETEDDATAQCAAFAPDIVVFDLLTIAAARCREIARRATTVSLSPIFDAMSEVALLFHRTARHDPRWSFASGGPEVRAGLRYSVVSSHCARIPLDVYDAHLAEDALAIAVSMGGTDAANKSIQVIDHLRDAPGRLLIWLLLGEGYAHSYQDIVERMKGSPHEIILAKTNDSMWRILRTCSLAVLAAGTTAYEAAYAGLPSVNLLESRSSFFLIDELVAGGACLGPAADFPAALAGLREQVTRLDRDRATLRAMHQRGQALIDGHGAERIVEETLAFHLARRAP